MVKKCASYNIGVRKIATDKGSFLIQVLITLAVVLAGILLQLNVIQWGIVALSSFIFLSTGFYRSAAHILTRFDLTMSIGQAVRLKAMSNFMLTITAGVSFFTYLIVFMPKINQLL
jgi:diacylglycerol kinase